MTTISFRLNKNLYLRDPQSSELGQKIISESINLLDTIGFEHFTFKKLADEIDSTEASVYRYFENKHRLLIYLIDWYWTWVDYRMELTTQNLNSAAERMKACLKVLTEENAIDPNFAFVDERALQRVVISEFDKTYLTKQVDKDNKEGLFLPYKVMCKRIAKIVTEMNPVYPFPHALVSTILLGATHQLYYAEHLPSLTDIKHQPKKQHQKLYQFLESVVLQSIKA